MAKSKFKKSVAVKSGDGDLLTIVEIERIVSKTIDLNALDAELCRIPLLMRSLTELIPEARKNTGEAKTELASIQAKLYFESKQAMVDMGERPTEKSIEHVINQDVNYLTANKNLLESKLEQERLENLRETLGAYHSA